MVPGVPGDVWCPNEVCSELDKQAAFAMVKEMARKERYRQYLKLKEEFDGPENVRPDED